MSDSDSDYFTDDEVEEEAAYYHEKRKDTDIGALVDSLLEACKKYESYEAKVKIVRQLLVFAVRWRSLKLWVETVHACGYADFLRFVDPKDIYDACSCFTLPLLEST